MRLLELACCAWDRSSEARQVIERDGLLLDGRLHPAVAVERAARGDFARLINQLKLTIRLPDLGLVF